MKCIDPDRLPTHLALVANRLNTVGPNASADTFLIAGYLFEATLKTLTIALRAPLRLLNQDEAYSIAHAIVRADGLGSWEEKLRHLTTSALRAYMPREYQAIVDWLTCKRSPEKDPWFMDCLTNLDALRGLIGLEPADKHRDRKVINLTSDLVLLRNKTKAHGAVGPDFFENANTLYISIIHKFLDNCPLEQIEWLHLSKRPSKHTTRAVLLKGTGAAHVPDARACQYTPSEAGIHLATPPSARTYFVGDLLRTTPECVEFYLPNGACTGIQAEFLNYANGSVAKYDTQAFSRPPAPLPASETEGLLALDVFANLFGNLPPEPDGYVHRPQLESELRTRLLDRNHPVITLHGRGGIGKTSLAIHVAHELSRSTDPRFDAIAWFSSRDIDLTLTGPKSVRTALSDLRAISRAFGVLFETGKTEEDFARALSAAIPGWTRGILFVFDNFETVDSARHVHEFLDTHTHLPNKVLITSRERAFKGDYPIEVRGMETAEASRLIQLTAQRLGAQALLNEERITSIFEHSDGHAYVMKLIVGEMAKEGRFVAPKTLLPQRSDIVGAVFDRSFNKLSEHGRRVFLSCCRWKSGVSELSLLLVLGDAGLDAEAGVEECVRMSLLDADELADGHRYFVAPELARIYGQKKFESDPDRLLIQQDVEQLQAFGLLPHRSDHKVSQAQIVDKFTEGMLHVEGRLDDAEIGRRDRVLTRLAELWPPAWWQAVEFRRRWVSDTEHVAAALRRLVEEFPSDSSAWMKRAEFAEAMGDKQGMVSSLVSAADAAPKDASLLREVAFKLSQFMTEHSADIPVARRHIYLAGVRSYMEALHQELDATGLSRLAWLFLLEKNSASARKYAEEGLRKDPDNLHCMKLVERISNKDS